MQHRLCSSLRGSRSVHAGPCRHLASSRLHGVEGKGIYKALEVSSSEPLSIQRRVPMRTTAPHMTRTTEKIATDRWQHEGRWRGDEHSRRRTRSVVDGHSPGVVVLVEWKTEVERPRTHAIHSSRRTSTMRVSVLLGIWSKGPSKWLALIGASLAAQRERIEGKMAVGRKQCGGDMLTADVVVAGRDGEPLLAHQRENSATWMRAKQTWAAACPRPLFDDHTSHLSYPGSLRRSPCDNFSSLYIAFFTIENKLAAGQGKERSWIWAAVG
ncbi:hypothetical protein BV25DRAFT_1048084 [Artomyces pyxidatus]|uniref:Uncharacterized protein n=1 Tax=Artomyces pyxidatus TaxID=48021 RepID=A0ACB8STC3_9AGAM|nr:hypothetical protein BV25DRAFT_1048084 [Artomyces pyxidatus]